MDRKEKIRSVLKRLNRAYPDAKIELVFSNPLELAVATILSAQCTDVKVNQVTPALFRRCRSAEDFAGIPQAEIEQLIKPTGFFRQKAKSIKKMAAILYERHNSKVPQTMDELVELPGIGRKTANVILGNAYSVPGFPVDTHVIRLSNRIGLTTETDPVKIEHDLCGLMPKAGWTLASHLLIFHGRRTCFARKPNCGECPITSLCTYFAETGDVPPDNKKAAKAIKQKTTGKKKNAAARRQPA